MKIPTTLLLLLALSTTLPVIAMEDEMAVSPVVDMKATGGDTPLTSVYSERFEF